MEPERLGRGFDPDCVDGLPPLSFTDKLALHKEIERDEAIEDEAIEDDALPPHELARTVGVLS